MSAAEDRAWRDYSQRFRREVLPKLLDSSVFMTIGTDVGEFDVTAGYLMGQPEAGFSKRWSLMADEWDGGSPDGQVRLAHLFAEAGLYTAGFWPRAVNWVRIELVWV